MSAMIILESFTGKTQIKHGAALLKYISLRSSFRRFKQFDLTILTNIEENPN
jgi:hypothetical protein